MSYAIGIDVGGTFTDFVLTASDRSELRIHKSPTTPSDPSDGVLNGLRELAELEGLETAEFLAATAMIVATMEGAMMLSRLYDDRSYAQNAATRVAVHAAQLARRTSPSKKQK